MSKFETLCNEYRENKRLIEELTAVNEGIKNQIVDIMGGAETMTAGAAKASNKTITSSKLNSAALKKDLPDVYTRYSSETSYKRFLVS